MTLKLAFFSVQSWAVQLCQIRLCSLALPTFSTLCTFYMFSYCQHVYGFAPGNTVSFLQLSL